MRLQDNPHISLVRYDDPAEWTEGIASEMADLLQQHLARHGQARMLLSGGTTPAPVYVSLAHRPLDWSRVEVGLVDERWLSPQDKDSNAWLIKHSFLEHAPAATFIPLVRPGKQLAECIHTANLQATHAEPACLAVLGMGGDGHTASLFPGSAELPKALAAPHPYASLDATGCPGANQWPLRITLTPAGLSPIPQRLLLLRGQQKLEVLEAALTGEDVNQYPIRIALQPPAPRLRVHWCG